MSINDMESKARSYREILAEIKALQEQADAIKAELIAEMDTRQAEAVAAGAFTIRYSAYESSRVNTAQLKADGLYASPSTPESLIRRAISSWVPP